MVEHQLPKLAFAGSIPVSRSTRHLFSGAFCKVLRESNREPQGTQRFAERSEKAMMPFQRVGPHKRGFPSPAPRGTF